MSPFPRARACSSSTEPGTASSPCGTGARCTASSTRRRSFGSGKVDFLEMAAACSEGGDMLLPMREWLLSGMCYACQTRTFDA